MYDFKYKHAIETIKKGKAGTLPAYEIYDMMPFMEQPEDDKELAAIEWGVGCLACRTMMGIGIDGIIYPAGYPTKLTLGNALKDNFEDILNSQLYKDIRDRKKIKGKYVERLKARTKWPVKWRIIEAAQRGVFYSNRVNLPC